MKTTIVLAVLLAATPAFAQYGSSYSAPSNGATMQDYRLAPHQRTVRQRRPLHMQATQTQATQTQATQTQATQTQAKNPECNMPFKKWSSNWGEYYHCY
jgi:hypothetical protein